MAFEGVCGFSPRPKTKTTESSLSTKPGVLIEGMSTTLFDKEPAKQQSTDAYTSQPKEKEPIFFSNLVRVINLIKPHQTSSTSSIRFTYPIFTKNPPSIIFDSQCTLQHFRQHISLQQERTTLQPRPQWNRIIHPFFTSHHITSLTQPNVSITTLLYLYPIPPKKIYIPVFRR